MKQLLILSLVCFGFLSDAQINTLAPGQPAPDFSLKNVDGKMVSLKDYTAAKGFIIVFTCNPCPYAKAYENRIIELNNKYAPLGYPVIAINPNDPNLSADDSFVKMQERAKQKAYPFPYLFDEGQVATNQYGARNTPHIFLVRKTASGNVVEYTGAIDNDTENTNPERIKYVEQAVQSLQENKTPALNSTRAIGCTVKRKKS